MNTKIKIFLLCPVPEDQKPMTEYIETKENIFFNWITSTQVKYRKNALIIFAYCFFSFLVFYGNDFLIVFFKNLTKIISLSTLNANNVSIVNNFEELTIFALLFPLKNSDFPLIKGVVTIISLSALTTSLIFLFIKSRWNSLHNRFNCSQLFYEESSWFDGQIWEKPFFLIKNDKLISTQKIQPIIMRLNQTLRFLIFFNFFAFSLLAFSEIIFKI